MPVTVQPKFGAEKKMPRDLDISQGEKGDTLWQRDMHAMRTTICVMMERAKNAMECGKDQRDKYYENTFDGKGTPAEHFITASAFLMKMHECNLKFGESATPQDALSPAAFNEAELSILKRFLERL